MIIRVTIPCQVGGMVIFFTCSTSSLAKYSKFYREVRKSILSLGHSINRDWLVYSLTALESGKRDVLLKSVYHEVMTAIITADLVVADATVGSMSIGHQITFALQKKKPVLLLQQTANGKDPKDLFICGAKSPLLMIRGYNKEEDIKKIVKAFIQKYKSRPRTRFNLVLNRAQDSFIEWASFQYKKSKTAIIQEAIDEKLERDKRFETYLDI